MHEDLIWIIFGKLISEDKKRRKDSKNMRVLQNDVRSNSRYIKILMDSGTSALIIHVSFVHTNKFNTS